VLAWIWRAPLIFIEHRYRVQRVLRRTATWPQLSDRHGRGDTVEEQARRQETGLGEHRQHVAGCTISDHRGGGIDAPVKLLLLLLLSALASPHLPHMSLLRLSTTHHAAQLMSCATVPPWLPPPPCSPLPALLGKLLLLLLSA
jgi:hypothetical protein